MSRPNVPQPDFDSEDVQDALAASGLVGLWTHDVWADRLVLSAPLACALGVEIDNDVRGVPLAALLARIHAEDRDRVENAVHAAMAEGGVFEIAFRIASGMRWFALRGRIERDGPARTARGRGIALDVSEDRAAARDGPAQHRLNRMAEHAVALRGLAGTLGRPALAELLDSVMIEIGLELAQHLKAADGQRH